MCYNTYTSNERALVDMKKIKSINIYKVVAVIIAVLLLAVLAVSCGGKEEEPEEKEETKVEYVKNSPLAIAEAYVGEDVQSLILALGTLKEDPVIEPSNDGGGYQGVYVFDGFTAYTYAKSEDSKAIVTEIVPDKNSDVYKESIGQGESKKSNGEAEGTGVSESGEYNSKEEVAEYLSIYKKLPKNYITKKEAKKLGWNGGSLEKYAPGKAIGGDKFGNYEKSLPNKNKRQYYECDIDTIGKKNRGAKRIVYSNDGLIYYTEDHYKHFEKLKQSA